MTNSIYSNLARMIDELQTKYEDLDANDVNDLDDELYDLGIRLDDEYSNCRYEDLKQLEKLNRQLDRIKRENDVYDQEATLDMMFPNRYDEDFDEDSMSYDSVFGDD